MIQITGRENYREAGAALGLPLEDHPELAAVFPAAAMTAGWFWSTRELNRLADAWNIPGMTRKINGGENGLAARLLYSTKATKALALSKKVASAIADPNAALKKAALIETSKAAAKSPALAAPLGLMSNAPAQSTAPDWMWIFAALGAAALAWWAWVEVRRHLGAAAALTAAAMEA